MNQINAQAEVVMIWFELTINAEGVNKKQLRFEASAFENGLVMTSFSKFAFSLAFLIASWKTCSPKMTYGSINSSETDKHLQYSS